MKTVRELYEYLNARIPVSLRGQWDNDGLMCCPAPQKAVSRVLVALDVTSEVVGRAISERFDVILSHHPMIFKGIKSVDGQDAASRKVIECIKNDIAVMSFHTRLDAVEMGVNDYLCYLLGIRKALPLCGEDGCIGRVGALNAPIKASDFALRVKEILYAPTVALSDAGKMVHKVAVVGGEGKDFVDAAIKCGADTYVSGSLGYHNMVDAPENGINLIEAGHFFTEFPVCRRLADLVREFEPKAETTIINSNRIELI